MQKKNLHVLRTDNTEEYNRNQVYLTFEIHFFDS